MALTCISKSARAGFRARGLLQDRQTDPQGWIADGQVMVRAMKFLSRRTILHLVLLLIPAGGFVLANTDSVLRLPSRYVGGGKWTVALGDVEPNRTTVTSATPGLKGFQIKGWRKQRDLYLVQEDFDDGTRYSVYLKDRAGLTKLYAMDGMLSLWKQIPSARGKDLLFIDDSSDYDSVDNVVHNANLFTVIGSEENSQRPTRMNCRLRDPDGIATAYKTRRDGNTVSLGGFLVNSVSAPSSLDCHETR